MVILENLAASFALSSSSSKTSELSEIYSNGAKVHISSQMTLFESHPALERHLTNPDLKPVAFDEFFLRESDLPVGAAEDFIASSDPSPAFADSGKGLFTADSLSASSTWTVEQICGVLAVTVIVPFILASNLLVIASVARFKRLQMPTNYFIVSLAAVDIFVALVTPFVIVIEVLPGQVSDLLLCLAPNRILMTACGVSVLTLAAIAYDRHTALVSPLKYVSVMTIRKIGVLVTLTWVYSASIVWAPLPLGWYSWRPLSAEPDPSATPQPCSFQLLHDNAHILFLSAIVGPACLAITVCYFRIFMVARHHARAIAAVEHSVHHNLRIRFIIKDAKYAKTLALVIGVFLLLWTPYLACLLAEVLADVDVSPWTWNYLTLLAVLNSGLNPWIYAFKNNEFRSAFRKIFRSCCSACPRFHKGSRRPSSLSDVHTATTTTTTTTTSHGRVSRLSRGSMTPSGRLSNVSCVVGIGSESAVHSNSNNSNKVFSNVNADVLRGEHVAKTLLPATLDGDALFYSGDAAEAATGKRVSTLLSMDSKAFITDLLSLYLHHSLISTRVGVDVEAPADPEDRDLSDHSDHSSADQSNHTDESYHSDNTEHSYHSVHTEHSYHSDITEQSYHSDNTENSYHSDITEQTYHSGNTENSYHSDITEQSYHSDNTENSYRCDTTDESYHCDNAENSDHSGNTDHSYHSDNRDHSDHTDHTYCSGDQSGQTSRSRHSFSYLSPHSSREGGHTNPCYQSDRCGHSEHSIDTLSTYLGLMYLHRTL